MFEQHLTISQAWQRDTTTYLSKETGLSKTQIKQTMQKGAVWLENESGIHRLRRTKKNASTGSTLHFYYNEAVLAQLPSAPNKIADHQDYSIWYKPYGVYCQGSKWGDHCTINRWIERNEQRPAIIVHRLDRATTGLIIIAHKRASAAAFTHLFETHRIVKKYRARVAGRFPHDSPFEVDSEIDGRKAISHVSLHGYNATEDISDVEISIESGRKHQIRRHLLQLGYPVIGDRLYNPVTANNIDLQLCCYYLGFNCPTNGEFRQYQLSGDAIFPV